MLAEETALICGRAAQQIAAIAAVNGVSDEQGIGETAKLEDSH